MLSRLVLPLVLLLTGCGTAPASSPQSLSGDPREVRDGDRVVGTGRVVQVPGSRVKLCASPESWADVGHPPGQEPPPQMCEQGVWLDGADLTRLAERREKAGAVEGRATVTGVLRGDLVVVESQEPAEASPTAPPAPSPAPVPCPEPDGGWPRDPRLLHGPGHPDEGDANMLAEQPALDRYRAQHPEQFVDVALLRPHPESVLLGVAAADDAARDALEAALRPAYGVRLCVVTSRWSRAQVDAADEALSAARPDRRAQGIFGSGYGVGDDLQPDVHLDVVALTPEIAELVAQQPAGLVQVEPWLLPAARAGS